MQTRCTAICKTSLLSSTVTSFKYVVDVTAKQDVTYDLFPSAQDSVEVHSTGVVKGDQ